jgi:hypothetical protein
MPPTPLPNDVPPDEIAETPPVVRPPRLSVGAGVVVAVLLAIPLAALAAVPVYSRTTPTVWGFPFFYWYQLMWVIITPILTYAAYLIIKHERGTR